MIEEIAGTTKVPLGNSQNSRWRYSLSRYLQGVVYPTVLKDSEVKLHTFDKKSISMCSLGSALLAVYYCSVLTSNITKADQLILKTDTFFQLFFQFFFAEGIWCNIWTASHFGLNKLCWVRKYLVPLLKPWPEVKYPRWCLNMVKEIILYYNFYIAWPIYHEFCPCSYKVYAYALIIPSCSPSYPVREN